MQHPTRLYALDYLRALIATGVVAYHFTQWNFGVASAEALFGRVAIYGVAMFYMLSGLSVYHAYEHKMQPLAPGMRKFIKRRLFRLYPLLWIATLLTIFLDQMPATAAGLFLNLTSLFGFVSPHYYYAFGAWSIGNELVFYCFVPLFFLALHYQSRLFWLIGGAALFAFVYFAFVLMSPNTQLIEQWHYYVNPLNQLFFFWAGFAIAYLLKHRQVQKRWLLGTLAVSAALFFLHPLQYEQTAALLHGVNRLTLTLACCGFCAVFYKTRFQLPGVLHRLGISVGNASYAIYILHPIIHTLTGTAFLLMSRYVMTLPVALKLPTAVMATFVCCYYINRNYERFLKKVLSKVPVRFGKAPHLMQASALGEQHRMKEPAELS